MLACLQTRTPGDQLPSGAGGKVVPGFPHAVIAKFIGWEVLPDRQLGKKGPFVHFVEIRPQNQRNIHSKSSLSIKGFVAKDLHEVGLADDPSQPYTVSRTVSRTYTFDGKAKKFGVDDKSFAIAAGAVLVVFLDDEWSPQKVVQTNKTFADVQLPPDLLAAVRGSLAESDN